MILHHFLQYNSHVRKIAGNCGKGPQLMLLELVARPVCLYLIFMSNKICLNHVRKMGGLKTVCNGTQFIVGKVFRLQGGGRCSNLGPLDQ